MLHIFLPSLVTEEREKGPYLTTDERKTFYEKGLRPAIEELLPGNVSEWPATVDNEMFRAKKHSGAFAYQIKMIPAYAVPLLADSIRENLDRHAVPWGEDLFVLHTIRGTKHSSKHSQNEEAAAHALNEHCYHARIPLESICNEGRWWIDVGLEFYSDNSCLQWTTRSHFHIARSVLGISDSNARRITRLGSSKYSRDIVSHLPEISGCRIEPGRHAEGANEVAYCQLYVTDKALTYNPEKGRHGKYITMGEAMGTKQPTPFFSGLYDLYMTARERNDTNARIELRVPFDHATEVLQWIPTRVVKDSLVAFRRKDWW
jgi:hypothetical protein